MFNKKNFYFYKKAVSLLLAFIFLFNISAQALVPSQLVSSEVKEELEEALSEEYTKKTSDPSEAALKECLKKGNNKKCEEYVNIIKDLFTTTRDKIENGKEGKEENYKPLSQKEYTKQLQKNTEEEYKRHSEKIEKQFKEESQRLENQYRGVSLKTPEYSDYMLAMSSLKKWQKENEKNLSAWQEEVLNNTGKYYKQYTEEFEKRAKEYQADKEKALQEGFKELANNLMKVYYKSSAQIRKKMVDLFVMLLSMESSDVKFFNSAQRSELYRFFTNLITPKNSGSKEANPCRFHTRVRYDSEMSDYYAYMEQKSAAEEARRSTLSIRDQTAKQARPYEQMIENALSAPITEPVEQDSCEAAMSALNGLSFYKGGWWDMSSVVVFMINNLQEPLASEILLMGAKTLIETDNVISFLTFQYGLKNEEVKSHSEDDLKLKEAIFFDNRFYRGPYKNSRYSEQDGGGDVFRDIAEMLSKEKTEISKQVQQDILDQSIYFKNGKVVFNNNLPLVYGILLHNPSVIDRFVPKVSILNNSVDPIGYFYNGQPVYSNYVDGYVELYIKSEREGIVSLGDAKVLNYDDGTGFKTKVVGILRKEILRNYQKTEEKRQEEYKKFFSNKKVSVFFAEAFYKADFVDLTVEEKLAMDKALEKKYPSLKKFSKGHKAQLEKNRRNLDIASGVITIIDVALTLWCVADLYKLAKWGIKGIKALRTLIVAGKTSATLSTARRIAFFRTIIAEKKEVLNIHRKIKKIKGINSRIINKFPSYSKGVELTRMSHDGQRVLTVTKLDGTPVTLGKNTVKNPPIKPEIPQIEPKQSLVLSQTPEATAQTIVAKERPFTFKNMMREIKAGLYLAKKNSMSFGKYLLYNFSYGRGKEIASARNILRIEGLETGKFFNNSHYITSKHRDIFRINKDMRRAGKIGISELGEGGQVLSYVDKVKMRTFADYTKDYLKGIEETTKSGETVKTTKTLMEGQTTLLPRDFLYNRKYKKVLPFVQEKEFSKQFNFLDKVYEYFRSRDVFFFNKKTGEIFTDLVWHPEGYISKNLLLGFDIMPSTKLARPFNFGARTGSAVNQTKLLEEFKVAEKGLVTSERNPLTLYNKPANPLGIKNNFTFKLPKTTSLFVDGNVILSKSINNIGKETQILSSQSIYRPGESLKEIPVEYDYVKDSGKPMVIAATLNKFLEELLEYSKTHVLSSQKVANYNEIINDIYHVLDNPLQIDKRFEYILEERDLFFDKDPLIVFKGRDVDLLNPNHLKDKNIFTYDLSKIDDYKSFMAEKIRHLSSLSKEYTIYVSIHGSRNAKLSIDRDRDITLKEILDIVSANRDSSTVNVISSSCHSGSALSTNLMKDGINLLLLSGANDVCTASDMRFVQVNDLRSTYLNAVKNKYYGSYLMYEDKVFNPIVNSYKYLQQGENATAKRELDLLRKIYFGDDPIGLNLFHLLSDYPKYFMPAYPFEILHNMGMIPFEFLPTNDLFNTFKAYLMPPTLDDKKWSYVLNRLDEYGYLVNVKKLPFEEVGTETYDFLINSATQELNTNFPEWEFKEVKASIFDSAPVYPEKYDDILRVNIFPKLEHNLPLIPTAKLPENKAYIISKINKDIEKLNKIDFNSFSRKKVKAYQEINRKIREIAAKPSAFTLAQLREVERLTYLLNMDSPYLVLQGIDLQVMLPAHIPSNNFRIINLSKEKKYQEKIAEEIRLFSSVFDNFTVYIDMHGDVMGGLKVTKDKYTRLNEIVDLINANRGKSKVDLISGSCHGGAGFNPYLVDSGINILLLSGSNEVCYASDKYLLRENLPSTYLNAVEAGRFGSYLIYQGKVYNPLKQALQAAKDNDAVKQELQNLEKIYLEKDVLGTNLAKDLLNLFTSSSKYQIRNFFDKTGITLINNEKLKLLPQMPFVLNPVIPSGQFALSYITGAPDYRYIFQIFDKNKQLQYKGGIEFGEPSGEIYNFILDASKNKLAGKTKIETTTPKPEVNNISSGEPNDFIFIKTPKNITKIFQSQGLNENIARRLSLSCFDVKNQKFNSVVFEKVQDLLQKGVEPKYIDTVIATLSKGGVFSEYLYERAIALSTKLNLSLVLSSYLVNACVGHGYFHELGFLELEKLLSEKFDFSKLSDLKMSDIYMEAPKRPLTSEEKAFSTLGENTSKILSAFATGQGSFDLENWYDFIYLSKELQDDVYGLNYFLDYFLSMKGSMENAVFLLGEEDVAKAIKLNEKRYLNVFRDLNKIFEKENLELLKAQIVPLPFEEKLKTLNVLSASVNRKKEILDAQGKKELIEKISTPQAFKEEINKLIFEQLDLKYTPELGEIFDFASNNYINSIIDSQYHFKTNLSLLYNEISKNIGKPVKQILDELPENKAFAETCAQRGISYEAWRSYDPDFSITRKVLINGGENPKTKIDITVRKVDMDDISKALTSGNDSSSCRSVGKGQCGEFSPNLIRNKMVQQLEVLVEGRPVGNALIYLAEVDGQTAIVLGSFVKRKPYFSYEVTELVLDFVRQFRSKITDKEIPIYYSKHLSINNYYNYPAAKHDVMSLGEGVNEIFNSFTHSAVMPYTHKHVQVDLFTIEEGRIKDPTKKEIFNSYIKKGMIEKEANFLTEQCFEGDKEVFNPDVLKAQEYLFSKNMDPRYIKSTVESLSPNGQFSQELFDKSIEFSDKYGESIFRASNIISVCLENGAFSPKMYEKVEFLYQNKQSFNTISFLKSCTVNGVFKEELFNKGLALEKDFGSNVPQLITEFTDAQGNFKEAYFNGFKKLLEETKHMYASQYDAVRSYLWLTEDIQKAFDLLGIDNTTKAVLSNKDRYLRTFQELFENIEGENAILLKEKLAPLPYEEKLKVITLLAGSINKKDKILNKAGIKNLIEKISDRKVFEEEINCLVFKQLGLKYTPEMAEIFNFTDNRYISLILAGDASFEEKFFSLFKALKNADGQNIHQKFDSLPENQSFAKMCAEHKVDYQAWRSYDGYSITRNVVMNSGKDPLTRADITVRKVDMDDILKALTSGNESGACRAVGNGACRTVAPDLVRNKMVQQVEYLHNGKVVGNVLIYLAEVNNELAIVMGSIIKKNTYYVSKDINELVIDYVRKIRQDIGRPDIPIYMSTYLKVENFYPMEWKRVQLIGDGEEIFNSFTHQVEQPSLHKTSTVLLYEVDEGVKNTTGFIKTSLNQENSASHNPSIFTKIVDIVDKVREDFNLPVFKLSIDSPKGEVLGTGFYLKYRNFPFILTAGHVVEGALSPFVKVFNDNGFSMQSEILNISEKSDLAVLNVPQGSLDQFKPWTLAFKEPKDGDKLLAVGFPDGKLKEKSKVRLITTHLTGPKKQTFYLHNQGKIMLGSSGSPVSKKDSSRELLGIVSAVHIAKPLAVSVPLPQIRNFLGETIKKILFTPELNQKYLPLYPDFAKNYENVLEKYTKPDLKISLDKTNPVKPQILGNNFKPTTLIKTETFDVFKDMKSPAVKWTQETDNGKSISAKVLFTEEYKNKKVQFHSWKDIKLIVKNFLPAKFKDSNSYFRGMSFDDYEDLKGVFEGLSGSKTVNGGGKVFFSNDVEYAMIWCTDYKTFGHLPVLVRKKQDKMMGIVATFDFVDPKDITDVLVWAQLDGKLGWWRASLDENGEVVLQPTENMQNVNVESEPANDTSGNSASVKNPLIKAPTSNSKTPNTNFKPASIIKINTDVFAGIKTNTTKWTQKTAENYLIKLGFSEKDIRQISRHCQVDKVFNSEIFDLFVKGYEIKPDKNFAMVALYYASEDYTFDYHKYSKIYAIAKKLPQIDYNKIHYYSVATSEQIEALFYVADNFSKVNPFRVMDLASAGYLFRTDLFKWDNYEKIIKFLEEGISFNAIDLLFNSCLTRSYTWDAETFNKIENIANAAIAKKETFLSAQNKLFTNADIKSFVYGLSRNIINSLKLVDETTIIAAMDYKMVRFENFLMMANRLQMNMPGEDLREQFLEILYPSKSKKAQELQNKIVELKSSFSNTPESELQDLKNQINTNTTQLRILLEQEKAFSPQEKIEMVELLSQFSNSKSELKELFDTITKINAEGKDIWNKKVFDLVLSRLGPAYNVKIEEKLHLLQSPYLMEIFKSLGDLSFKKQFVKLLDLLSKEDFGKTLDGLDHNIVTQQEFKKYALNYQEYTNPKVFPSRTFYVEDNLVEIRQVNMRDASKSLFLGNESGVCTAIGSSTQHDKYAIPYIENTFVGAIEVLLNGKPIGNTMIYPMVNIINQEQEISLLIDELKIKSPYNKPEYLQGVALVAEDIAKNIGIKDGKVYISDSNTLGYDRRKFGSKSEFYLIGKTGDKIFLNTTLTYSQSGSVSDTHVSILVPAEKIK